MLSVRRVIGQANQESPFQKIIMDAVMAIYVSFAYDKALASFLRLPKTPPG
jgi:hypothetical protein